MLVQLTFFWITCPTDMQTKINNNNSNNNNNNNDNDNDIDNDNDNDNSINNLRVMMDH